MATFYEIPLSPEAQSFFVTLAGVQYQMQVMWRTATEGGWFLDIMTPAGVPIIQGLPLLPGLDLMAPYPDLDLGGSLYVATDGDLYAAPKYANLGVTSHLYFVPAT